MRPLQTRFAPEGASRCRAVASGLFMDRVAELNFNVSIESRRNLWSGRR